MQRNMIYQYVKDLTAGRIASGFGHCFRVYHLARELDINKEEYDDDVLYAACFLHDLVVGEGNCSAESAKKAEQLLQEVGFQADKIVKVVECIKSHWPGDKPTLIEAKLLHDANLLDSLGAIGVVRLSIGSFFWYHHKTLTDVLNLIKEYRAQVGSLFFDKSKTIATKKIKIMDELIDELSREENL